MVRSLNSFLDFSNSKLEAPISDAGSEILCKLNQNKTGRQMTIFLKQTFDFLSIIKVIFKAIILSDLLLVNQTKHLKFIITFHI